MTKSKTKAKAKSHKPAAKKKIVKTTAKKKPAVKAKTVAAPKKVVKPATPEHMGRNPQTGEPMMIKAKPKRVVAKALALKALKEMVK